MTQPWWRDAVPNLETVTRPHDGYGSGWRMTVPVADMATYLSFLVDRATRRFGAAAVRPASLHSDRSRYRTGRQRSVGLRGISQQKFESEDCVAISLIFFVFPFLSPLRSLCQGQLSVS